MRFVIDHQVGVTNMAKFFALPFGSWPKGFFGKEAALGVRPRCVQAPGEVSISLRSANGRR